MTRKLFRSSIGCLHTLDDTLVPMRNRARLLIAAAFAGGSVLLLSCNGGTPITPANSYGTVTGSVNSTLGSGIAAVSVVVTPTGGPALTAVTTNSSGAFSVANVPVGTAGTGTITVSGLPQNCQSPGSTAYSGLPNSGSTTQNVRVTCVPPVDTIVGQVSSSLGGAVAGVSAVVTPSGGSALPSTISNSGGSFTVIESGTTGGSITLSNIPNNCVTPSPVTYTGSAAGGTVTVPITLSCSSAAGAITGTILSSQGNVSIGAGVGVVVTPHGSSALPAVSTNANGVFTITGVSVADGTGSLTFTNLPSNCPTPTTATSYTGLTSGKTLTVNVTITCNPPAGSITGTVSSSLGGGLSGLQVIVTPSGGSAMAAVATNATGVFTVASVPVGSGTGAGTGTVAVNHLAANCTPPTSPANYTGLANGNSVTVNITITCTTPFGVIRGTIIMAWGQAIPGVQATATPTGGQPVAAAAVSDSTGAFVIGGVPVGAGTGQVTFTLPPVNCPTINAQNYSGLTNANSVTLYVVPSCTKTGALLVNVATEGVEVPNNTLNATLTGTLNSSTVTTLPITQPGLINPLDSGSFAFAAATYESFDPTVPQIFYADSITQFGTELQIDTTHTPIAVGLVDTISVTYAWRDGTGELWVADSSTMIMAGFNGTDLRSGGTVSSANLISMTNPMSPTGMALDKDNRLWTSLGPDNQIIKWRDSAEFGGVLASYMMVQVTSGLSNPQGLAFDQTGLLWAANAGSNSITAINESGTITLTLTSTALNQPYGLAFDVNGNLWVSNVGNNTIVEFTASQIATAGSQTPAVILSATSSSLSSPTALAFDPSGNLWVTNTTANTVVSFGSSALAATGSPAPSVTISANSGSLSGPRALAFDFGGNLWVANEAASTVVEYNTAQLASGGSITPTSSVNSPGGVIGAPSALAFNPQPTNVPINGSRVTKIIKGGLHLNTKTLRKAPVKPKK